MAVIGGGNMSQAIVFAGLDADAPWAARIVVAEPDAAKRAMFTCRGVHAHATVVAAMAEAMQREESGEAAAILLAVKPQVLHEVAPAIRDMTAGRSHVVFSVLAGMTTARLCEALGSQHRVVRAMPNLPAAIREGITAVCRGNTAREDDLAAAEAIFKAIGPTVLRLDESLIDAFTAIAGSGPAYVYYLAESMTLAAEQLGLSHDAAKLAVTQTLVGAVKLLTSSGKLPQELRAAVTSRGGTTAAAINVFEERGVREIVAQAAAAARDRGRELGR